MRMGFGGLMRRACHVRIQRREYAIRVLAIIQTGHRSANFDMCASSSAVLGSSAIASYGTPWNVGRLGVSAARDASANTTFSTATSSQAFRRPWLVNQNARCRKSVCDPCASDARRRAG